MPCWMVLISPAHLSQRRICAWTSLKGANLTGADLTGALYDDKTVWPDGFDPDKAGAKRE